MYLLIVIQKCNHQRYDYLLGLTFFLLNFVSIHGQKGFLMLQIAKPQNTLFLHNTWFAKFHNTLKNIKL